MPGPPAMWSILAYLSHSVPLAALFQPRWSIIYSLLATPAHSHSGGFAAPRRVTLSPSSLCIHFLSPCNTQMKCRSFHKAFLILPSLDRLPSPLLCTPSLLFFLLVFKNFIFLRDRVCTSGRGTEREGDRIPSRLCTISTEAWMHEP